MLVHSQAPHDVDALLAAAPLFERLTVQDVKVGEARLWPAKSVSLLSPASADPNFLGHREVYKARASGLVAD